MAITTTKYLVAQGPVYTQDEAGNLVVSRYLDVQEYPFTTTEERQAVAPECRRVARSIGGRVILRTKTVDDKGTDSETDDDITITERVIEIRDASDVTVTLNRAQAHVLVNRLGGFGERWADAVAARLQQALA